MNHLELKCFQHMRLSRAPGRCLYQSKSGDSKNFRLSSKSSGPKSANPVWSSKYLPCCHANVPAYCMVLHGATHITPIDPHIFPPCKEAGMLLRVPAAKCFYMVLLCFDVFFVSQPDQRPHKQMKHMKSHDITGYHDYSMNHLLNPNKLTNILIN